MFNSTNQSQPPQVVLDQIIELYNQGHLLQTVSLAERLTQQYPKATILYEILGAAYIGLKNADKIIESYQKVLKLNPVNTDAYNNKGMALFEQGKFDEAVQSYQQALEIEPDFADAHYNLGNALKQVGELKQAIESYKASLAINPNDAEVLLNCGNALKSYGDFDQAIEFYIRALRIDPNSTAAQTNMDKAVEAKTEIDKLVNDYATVTKLEIGSAEVVSFTGTVLSANGYLDIAIESYKQAIKIDPDYTGVYSDMGITFKNMGNIDAAIDFFNQALTIKPDYADAQWNQSLAFLSKGDYDNGWSRYEWRWKASSHDSPSLCSQRPRWDPGKAGRILLWPEQGIGDIIMFSSMIFELYQQAEQLIIQIDERLIPLFSRSFPEDIIYYPANVEVPETAYDTHIPFGSLPMHFRPDLASFKPTSKAYLKANKRLSSKLRDSLIDGDHNYIVGITWRGGSKKNNVLTNKSVELAEVAQVLNKKGVKLVSLQYGDTDDECKKLKTDYGINIHKVAEVDNFNDLDGLAALVDACDHIVSTDNLTVHIAGALCKQTTVLLPFSADWRWGLKRENSYWHSSLRLLKQSNISDWSVPLEKLKTEFDFKVASSVSNRIDQAIDRQDK